jgi:glycosyltransferase involved in cell wall biosynthesis
MIADPGSRAFDVATPRISVIVRSFNRLAALAELLEALLGQDHPSFEIVVVEQTPTSQPEDRARVDALARDPRIRILTHPPLGGPAARNTGVRSARGELLVFIDDDDLPASPDWLRRHEANFEDPRCLGATGQFVSAGRPYGNLARARRQVLSFNLLKWQRVYARTDERKRVESLMGGNVAIPRSTLVRFGLWDECTPIEDEPSLAYRINAAKLADEYLLFDPGPKMIRRLDIAGGMAKRTLSGPGYARRVFTFLHNIVGHYFPIRFALLYPVYICFVAYHVLEWIWSDSKRHATLGRRLVATLWICLTLIPLWAIWLVEWWGRRIWNGEPARRPELPPRGPTDAEPRSASRVA